MSDITHEYRKTGTQGLFGYKISFCQQYFFLLNNLLQTKKLFVAHYYLETGTAHPIHIESNIKFQIEKVFPNLSGNHKHRTCLESLGLYYSAAIKNS